MKKQYKVSETKGDVQEIAEAHTYLSGTSKNFINLLKQRKTLIILIRVVVKVYFTRERPKFEQPHPI